MPDPSVDSTASPSASRLHYAFALVGAFLATGFAGIGWPSLASSARTSGLITVSILLTAVVARLIWVFRNATALQLPSSAALRRVAIWGLRLSMIGALALIGTVGSRFFLQALPQDTRGAVGLVTGLLMLPFITLAPVGLMAFEVARGLDQRSIVPADSRTHLRTAAVFAALVTVVPWLLTTSLRYLGFPSLTGLLSLGSTLLLAIGVGAMILQARRTAFPVGAVFGTAAVVAFASGVGVTTLGMLNQGLPLGLAVGSLIGLSGIAANLGGAIVAAVLTSLPLSIVPAIARSWSNAGPDDSGHVRYWIAAALSVLAVLGLGFAKNAPRLAKEKARLQATALSDTQLRDQARLLQQRCESAGTRLFATRTTASAIEVIFPGRYPPNYGRFPALSVEPEPGRPYDWFPMSVAEPSYESLVFNFNDQRIGYVRDPEQVGGTRGVSAETMAPRFALTWQRLDTAEEVAAGIAGIEFRAFDAQDKVDLATHRMFFKRESGYFGFREACGASSEPARSTAFAFRWLSTVVVPGGSTLAPGPETGKDTPEPDDAPQ